MKSRITSTVYTVHVFTGFYTVDYRPPVFTSDSFVQGWGRGLRLKFIGHVLSFRLLLPQPARTIAFRVLQSNSRIYQADVICFLPLLPWATLEFDLCPIWKRLSGLAQYVRNMNK
jgi:hypothetical protein